MGMHLARTLSALFCLTAVWATAGQDSKLPHFFQVDEGIYRGAQPKAHHFAQLAKMGVATVVSLRSTGDGVEEERKLVESLGMRFVNIPLRGYRTPPDASVRQAVAELEAAQATGKPVFVHCKLGKDRTGTVVACYRMKRLGWKPEQALQEAKSLGMSRRQWKMQRFVLGFDPLADTPAASAR